MTFKYGLGEEFIGVLRTLNMLGLDSTEPLRVRGVEVAPRDVVAAALPDPATLGDQMSGRTCAGTLVTGTGKDGAAARDLPLPRGRQRDDDARGRLAGRRVADRGQPGRGDGAARASGAWSGAGVLGPEAFDAVPFLDKLAELGSPHGVDERDPANPLSR